MFYSIDKHDDKQLRIDVGHGYRYYGCTTAYIGSQRRAAPNVLIKYDKKLHQKLHSLQHRPYTRFPRKM